MSYNYSLRHSRYKSIYVFMKKLKDENGFVIKIEDFCEPEG